MKKSDFGVVSVIYAIGLGFLWMTLDLPEGAQTYPLVLITALLAVNTLYLVRSFWAFRSTHHIEDDVSTTFKNFIPIQFLGVLSWCIGYLVLMYVVGYYLSTVIFMVGTMLFLKVKPLYIFISVLVIAAMVAAVFSSFLHVPLPTGMLFR